VDVEAVHSVDSTPRLTWIGHASFLGAIGGRHFLIDPVFSSHAGVWYQRFDKPGLSQADLPPLAAVMVTHNHYDHLDSAAIRRLPEDVAVIVPAGMGRWCRRRNCRRVIELGWWESVDVDGLGITLVPSCHWSRRGIFDTNRALWGGFVVGDGSTRVYHPGDTAWFDGFREIGQRFPGLSAAMLPIGGYDPAWFMEHYHLSPEQAGRAFLELKARCFVPMHWGSFRLTDEPLCEPADRIRTWWDHNRPSGHEMALMSVGQTIELR
jgi:L-ascorbate metabolism protein UlaG (beta-lactamase superfamily)